LLAAVIWAVTTNISTAVAAVFEIQRRHHHEACVGVGVEITTSCNSSCMGGFSSGGHTTSVPSLAFLFHLDLDGL
jgi:hypothetical protein